MASLNICRGLYANGQPCRYRAIYDGFCGYHRHQQLRNPNSLCRVVGCGHFGSVRNGGFCNSHFYLHAYNTCNYRLGIERCDNLTNGFFCREHMNMFAQTLSFEEYTETLIVNNHMSWGPPPPTPTNIQIPIKQKFDTIILVEPVDDPCSICLENFKPQTSVYKLKCKHYFHKKCLKQWMKQKPTCPLDRQKLET